MADVPELTDGTVALRQWRLEDAEWYAAQAADPDIQQLTAEPPDLTAQQVRDAITRYADDPAHCGWVICAANTGERLGNAGVDLDEASVSYWVAASARGRGVATAALRLMAAHTFAGTDLVELRLWVKAGNHASARVAEKAGFRRAPHLDRTVIIKGDPWPAEYHTLPGPFRPSDYQLQFKAMSGTGRTGHRDAGRHTIPPPPAQPECFRSPTTCPHWLSPHRPRSATLSAQFSPIAMAPEWPRTTGDPWRGPRDGLRHRRHRQPRRDRRGRDLGDPKVFGLRAGV